ncbi:acyl-CoA thioesterase [Derxia gummosa]|uniref:Acyl-CoA thioesterase n=1 Tax=Derxia gummosa DSM 723 TaxID=1121388 RepID=A0A8B6X682_9BURK|nr:thioesterase family protein [Derxia gummosa]
MSAPSPADLANRDRYPHWSQDTLRFSDTDKLGHINNLATAAYCETGRAHFLKDLVGADLRPERGVFVLARFAIDYRAEMHWPGTVEVGSAVSAVGRSSLTIVQGVFEDGRCTATAENVMVLIDVETRRSMPIPDELRASFEALRLR